MMLAGWCCIYALAILLVGGAITAAVLRMDDRRSIPETVALAMLLGCGGMGTILFWLSLVGIRPSRAEILAISGASLVALVAKLLRRQLPLPRSPGPLAGPWSLHILLVPPACVLLAGVAATVIIANGMPILNWDSFVIWGLKAKVLFYAPLRPRPAYFNDLALNYSHLNYPLLFPMLLAGGYAAVGEVNEQLAKVVLPMLFVGQMLLSYSGARFWLGRISASVVTTMLVCTPANLLFASNCTADTTLATFQLGAAFYLVRWISSARRKDVVLSALFTTFAATTKNEGLALAVMTTLTLLSLVLIKARTTDWRIWRDLAIYLLVAWVGIGIWLVWRSGLPATDENYPGRLSFSMLVGNVNRLPMILAAMARAMTGIWSWGGLWILLPLVSLLGFAAFIRLEAQVLWAMLLLHLAIYALAYMISPWDVQELLRVSIRRLLLHVAPTAALLMAIHWSAIQRRALPHAASPHICD